MFDRLADMIIRHPKKIIAVWLVILIASVGVILTTESNLKYDMTTMEGGGSESVDGMAIISEEFYSDGKNTAGIIVAVEYTDSTDEFNFYTALVAAVNTEYGGTVTVQELFKDDVNGIALMPIGYPNTMKGSSLVPEIRDIIDEVKTNGSITTVTTYVTGTDAISYDTETGAMEDVKKIDPISILLILILIGLFFRSFVASPTPPLVVGAAYGIVTCMIYFLGGIMDIFYITPILLLVSMLGAGCDYCIFIISRYREERRNGEDKEQALRESIKWAGESIATSGCSVIIGFGVMSVCSFSLVSTMGVVLAIGIVVALLAALTLIPSILMLAGDKIFYPSTMESYTEGSKAMNGWYGNWSRRGQRYFTSSAKHAIKYAKPIVLATVLVTAPLAYITLTEETSYDMISTMPPGEAKDGVDLIVDNVGGGIMMPTYEVMEFQDRLWSTVTHTPSPYIGKLEWTPNIDDYVDVMKDMDESIAGLNNVQYTLSLYTFITLEDIVHDAIDDPTMTEDEIKDAIEAAFPYYTEDMVDAIFIVANDIVNLLRLIPAAELEIDLMYNYLAIPLGLLSIDGMHGKSTVIMIDEPMSALAMTTIDEIRGVMNDTVANSGGLITAAWTTGSVAITYDISEIVNEEFMWIEVGVVILIFLLLFFVMRSYLTPLRAIVTILMSIAWTLGLTHIIFGWWLGMDIIWVIPIVLLVVCLGLGMDYDILLTTRIRENRLKGMSNDDAIQHAVEKSGAVITLCGLIMAGTFSTLMLSSSPMLMQFGFALGFAILVDALIVRTYIVPAIMHLLGDWNWKGPKWMQKGKHEINFENKEE